jgi:dTDP-4-amino-4,6-dideoxygalactose transaminase
MDIPLSKPYLNEEMKQRVLEVMESGNYILGKECKAFEEEFARYIGTKHAVLTSSGTSAIFLILKAMGVGPGDGILVPSLTAFPTIEPIFHVGATPIFIDIDDTFTVDSNHIESVLKQKYPLPQVRKIKGILPVHLYGHPADLDPILDLAKGHNLFVLEDCCQAHGAKYKGVRVGSKGMGGCFSFYPSKNLTVFGDGGILVTSDDDLAETCRMLRDHGRKQEYGHELVGFNLRFNEIQGAVGRLQLQKLDWFNESRRFAAQWYHDGLQGSPVLRPSAKAWVEHVYQLYVIQTEDRDHLAAYLKKKGVQTGVHYPIPNHQQPAVQNTLGFQPKLERTEAVTQGILSLPMFPELQKEQVDFVCHAVREFFDRKG